MTSLPASFKLWLIRFPVPGPADPKPKAKDGEYILDLKKFLKSLKLNEESISMVLGALVIVIVGFLVVNYFKDRGTTNVPGANTQGAAKVHTVTKGETLWSIAEDAYGSGYNWVDVKSANNLKTETIEVGQELTLPDVSPKKPTVTKTVETVKTATAISGDTYTVVHGDNLWNIAVRAYGDGYQWVKIAHENKLANPNLIHAGNVLVLPR